VKEAVDLFYGLCHSTMLHEEPFEFMLLGMLLERAGQTARILDVNDHTFGARAGARQERTETPAEMAQWIALLHSCSAAEPFIKRT
jgi:uncharacterized alpha-E superfamily protein